MRILRVQLAHGFHAEAKADSRLLGHLGEGYESLTIFHEWPGDRQSAERFEAASGSRMLRLDTGWRPSNGQPRSLLAKGHSSLRLASAFPRMLWQAYRWKPDVIDSSQQRWDCMVASAIAWSLRKPHVIHLHYTVPWIGGFARRRLAQCAHVVTVSEFIRTEAQTRAHSHRVTAIRNAMAPLPPQPPGTREAVREELGIPADAPLVGIIGRLEESKGQADTISALASLAERHPQAHLIVVGRGSAREQLEELALSLGVHDRVHFTGYRTDVPRILGALDLFSHPSLRDPCPLALLEAAAAGCPAIAYADGGAPELVADGETGLLAPTGDVDALAKAMDTLLSDEALRTRVGERARERVASDFTPEAAGAAYAAVLNEVAG